MKTKKSPMPDLRELLGRQLIELLDGEKQLIKALPRFAKAAASEELRAAMEAHLDQTEEHVNRLEQVLETFEETDTPSRCAALKTIIDEAAKVVSLGQLPARGKRGNGFASEAVLDAALIGAAQQIEHYEIASYGTLCAWAKVLEEDEAASLLQETLEEEKATDEELTELAERLINPDAAEDELNQSAGPESVYGAQASQLGKPREP